MDTGVRTALLFAMLWAGMLSARAQTPTPQDCLGALPICRDTYEEPDPYAYSNSDGNYIDEIEIFTDSCITHESNGMWYSFTPQTDGQLRFTITPHDLMDDYDWIVFDLTNGNCADLATDVGTWLVSSNTYGQTLLEDGSETPFVGFTGAHSDSSGGNAGNCNGNGAFNGPPFNDDIPVKRNRNYMLYISNWSNSQYGYDIDFTPSSASLYDTNLPVLAGVSQVPTCSSNRLVFKYTERINCKDINQETFEITGSSGKITLKSVAGYECSLGADYAQVIEIETMQTPGKGLYELREVKSVRDACNNLSINTSISFEVTDIPSLDSTVATNPPCHGDKTGNITIYATGTNLSYSIDNGKNFTGTSSFNDLKADDYQPVIKDMNGCQVQGATIAITEPAKLEINRIAVSHITNCEGISDGTIAIEASGGTPPLRYSLDDSPPDILPQFTDLTAGKHTIAVIDSMGCQTESPTEIKADLRHCLTIPNAFTPNGDGMNDTWEIDKISLYPQAQVNIFDRNGTLIFSGSPNEEAWDGSQGNSEAPMNTYYYVLTLSKEYTLKGDVSIVR